MALEGAPLGSHDNRNISPRRHQLLAHFFGRTEPSILNQSPWDFLPFFFCFDGCQMGISKNRGNTQNGWFIMENPI